MKAAPWIGGERFFGCKQGGADGIEVDVIANSAEVTGRIAIDEERFVASAEDVAEKFVAVVEPNGVGAEKPAHAFDEIRLGRFGHQVKMISHEAICVKLPAGFLAGFSEGFKEILAIDVVEENVFAAISTTHEMVDRASILDSRLTRHAIGLTK